MEIEGFGSGNQAYPIYLVELGIHDLPYVKTRAVIGNEDKYALLGRDILNSHRLVFDGPKLRLEIE